MFVVAIFACIFKAAPDADTMRWALLAIGLSQLIGFLFDLVGLRNRSFAWLKLVAGRGLARVLVVQLAIIFGMALAALTGHNAAFGIPFAGLKLLVDLGTAFATEKPPQSDDGPRVADVDHEEVLPERRLRRRTAGRERQAPPRDGRRRTAAEVARAMPILMNRGHRRMIFFALVGEDQGRRR